MIRKEKMHIMRFNNTFYSRIIKGQMESLGSATIHLKQNILSNYVGIQITNRPMETEITVGYKLKGYKSTFDVG